MTEISVPFLANDDVDGPSDLGVARRLALASDVRRRKVERLLHDGVQQHMALLGLRLSMLRKIIDTQPESAAAMCDELRNEIQQALRDLRTVAHLIYPAVLENEGLAPALQQAADRLGVEVETTMGRGKLPESIASAFYFCCLEVFDAAVVRSGPDARVRVDVTIDGGWAFIEIVAPVGSLGIDANSPEGGVQHIADRMVALGGACRVTNDPDAGTTISGRVPLEP